jgi:hypothetical protein
MPVTSGFQIPRSPGDFLDRARRVRGDTLVVLPIPAPLVEVLLTREGAFGAVVGQSTAQDVFLDFLRGLSGHVATLGLPLQALYHWDFPTLS